MLALFAVRFAFNFDKHCFLLSLVLFLQSQSFSFFVPSQGQCWSWKHSVGKQCSSSCNGVTELSESSCNDCCHLTAFPCKPTTLCDAILSDSNGLCHFRQMQRHLSLCRHERELKAQGKSQEDIRKPRFMVTGDQAPDYPDGSKTTVCALCPIKRGLFKQTSGVGRQWVHTVCALWQAPEVTVPQVDQPDIVRSATAAHVLFACISGCRADGLPTLRTQRCMPQCSTARLLPASAGQTLHPLKHNFHNLLVSYVLQIRGLDNIKPERRSGRCAYCRLTSGATVRCGHSKCHTVFHPLCARRANCFSLCKHAFGRGRPTYRTWCRQHSDAAQRREREAVRAAAAPAGSPGAAKATTSSAAATGGAGALLDAGAAEELLALQAKLEERQRVAEFLQVVRLNLESARISATQVEKREKEKLSIIRDGRDEFELVLDYPAECAVHRGQLGLFPFRKWIQHSVESKQQQRQVYGAAQLAAVPGACEHVRMHGAAVPAAPRQSDSTSFARQWSGISGSAHDASPHNAAGPSMLQTNAGAGPPGMEAFVQHRPQHSGDGAGPASMAFPQASNMANGAGGMLRGGHPGMTPHQQPHMVPSGLGDGMMVHNQAHQQQQQHAQQAQMQHHQHLAQHAQHPAQPCARL